MRKAILFIAMSLDGYIADPDGKVDWLDGEEDQEEGMDSYSEFVKGIDTIFMGWNTYHQIVTELSPAEWIYGDFMTYVITHHKRKSENQICLYNRDPADLLTKLKKEEGKDIWFCEGANLAKQLMSADLIDRYHISVIPTLLGKGIRLFGELPRERKLALKSVQRQQGITELIYERK